MLFVDLWQSPILGFTHYETCLKTQESMTENKALEKESQL